MLSPFDRWRDWGSERLNKDTNPTAHKVQSWSSDWFPHISTMTQTGDGKYVVQLIF